MNQGISLWKVSSYFNSVSSAKAEKKELTDEACKVQAVFVSSIQMFLGENVIERKQIHSAGKALQFFPNAL